MTNDGSNSASRANRLAMYGNNKFKIGMFGANQHGGRTYTKSPDRWSGSWEDCVKLAKLTDDAGFDFMLPVATWKAMPGGEINRHPSFETVTWASGLLAQTKRMTIMATVHAPVFHPILAAKQFATADHIGRGRFGVNVTVGWNPADFKMFGTFGHDHAARYGHAQEWIDAIKKMWDSEELFDFDGDFIKLKEVISRPGPYGGSHPYLINAAHSEIGQQFATRNFDGIFTANDQNSFEDTSRHIRGIKDRATQIGRDVAVFAICGVTCAKTTKEAEEYYHYSYLEQADWGVLEQAIRLRDITPESVGKEEFDRLVRNAALNGLGGFSIVGDPDKVAAELARCAETGINGIGLHMVNYLKEAPFFIEEVLPRLERLGLRSPVNPS